MATIGQDDILVTAQWVDAAVANTALASASAVFQNISPSIPIRIVGGTASASAPDATGTAAAGGTGLMLHPGESVLVNSGTVWVKHDGGGSSNTKLAVSLV